MGAQFEYYLNFLLQTRGAEEGDEEDGKEILNVFIAHVTYVYILLLELNGR